MSNRQTGRSEAGKNHQLMAGCGFLRQGLVCFFLLRAPDIALRDSIPSALGQTVNCAPIMLWPLEQLIVSVAVRPDPSLRASAGWQNTHTLKS